MLLYQITREAEKNQEEWGESSAGPTPNQKEEKAGNSIQ